MTIAVRPVRTSAKAILVHDGRLLVVEKRDAGGVFYTLPGGGQEPGENLHDALRRECWEEVGAKVTVGALRFVRDYISRNHEFADADPDFHQVEFLFACEAADPAGASVGAVPDDGQTGIAWLPLDQLNAFRLYPAVLKTLLASSGPQHASPVYLGDVN